MFSLVGCFQVTLELSITAVRYCDFETYLRRKQLTCYNFLFHWLYTYTKCQCVQLILKRYGILYLYLMGHAASEDTKTARELSMSLKNLSWFVACLKRSTALQLKCFNTYVYYRY